MCICPWCRMQLGTEEIYVLEKCKHLCCHECLYKHVNQNVAVKIKCPHQDCPVYLRDAIIRQYLSDDNVKLYETISLALSSPNVRKCLIRECPECVYVDTSDVVYHCNYCNQPNCLLCNKIHLPYQCGDENIDESIYQQRAMETIKIRKIDALKAKCVSNDLTNPEGFKCEVCDFFILPRQGKILRNCNHACCRECFDRRCKNIKNINDLNCLICHRDMDNKDSIDVIGSTKMTHLALQIVGPKFFNCKADNCNGIWEVNVSNSVYTCPLCNEVNCLECKDVHKGMSCEKFRKTKRYQDTILAIENAKEYKSVSCSCGNLLVIQGGCSALICPNCHSSFCQFTGKKPGNSGPDSCGCCPSSPCDPDCKYGCYPD